MYSVFTPLFYATHPVQVILDKNPRLRSVVNKVGTIENEWRVFDMEVLASRCGARAAGRPAW